MKIRLTRKFADVINGVDLSKAHAGQTLDLSPREAEILLAEGWAEREAIAQDSNRWDRSRRDTRPRRRRRQE